MVPHCLNLKVNDLFCLQVILKEIYSEITFWKLLIMPAIGAFRQKNEYSEALVLAKHASMSSHRNCELY